MEALNRAGIERGHLISINACNTDPDAAACFNAHFCFARPGSGRPGRVAYDCLNVDASWGGMHHQIGVAGSGKDVISITGSSNCSGRSVLYVFYWQDADA